MVGNDMVNYVNKWEGDIILIGTNHKSRESGELVYDIISEKTPDVIGVEQCPNRLWDDGYGSTYTGIRGIIINMLSELRDITSREQTGFDLSGAKKASYTNGIPILPLDRDFISIRQKFVYESPLPEVCLWAYGKGPRSDPEEIGTESDIEQEEVALYLKHMEDRYPYYHSLFIKSRDKFIAWLIEKLSEKGFDGVYQMGAAHKPGVYRHLRKTENYEFDEDLPHPSQRLQIIEKILDGTN